VDLQIDISYIGPYVAVTDPSTGVEYFSQGEDAESDIDYIDDYGEEAFLDYLASSGFFDRG